MRIWFVGMLSHIAAGQCNMNVPDIEMPDVSNIKL